MSFSYPPICKYFLSQTGCWRGHQCRYLHPVFPAPLPNEYEFHPPEEDEEEEQEQTEEEEEEDQEEEEEEDVQEEESKNTTNVTPLSLFKCDSLNCKLQVDREGEQCAYCHEWQKKLDRVFAREAKKKNRQCKNFPECKNDPGEHNFCESCYYTRKEGFYRDMKEKAQKQSKLG